MKKGLTRIKNLMAYFMQVTGGASMYKKGSFQMCLNSIVAKVFLFLKIGERDGCGVLRKIFERSLLFS